MDFYSGYETPEFKRAWRRKLQQEGRAYDEGVEAYQRGMPIHTNPHVDGGRDWVELEKSWRDGWQAADDAACAAEDA